MQLVSFQLAKELYGIEITKVREIILDHRDHADPATPQFVKGIINFRSMVIPVIDLAESVWPDGGRVDRREPDHGASGGRQDDRDRGRCGERGVACEARPDRAAAADGGAGLGREYLTGLVRAWTRNC